MSREITIRAPYFPLPSQEAVPVPGLYNDCTSLCIEFLYPNRADVTFLTGQRASGRLCLLRPCKGGTTAAGSYNAEVVQHTALLRMLKATPCRINYDRPKMQRTVSDYAGV